MSIDSLIELIREGEPVSPGTPNRPLRQLDQKTQYLYEIIQAAALGSTVYARRQTVESAVQLGMPVYYNAATQQFERALAGMETDPDTGELLTSDSSQVWGIVAKKHNATLADLLLYGYLALDISLAIEGDEDVTAGLYYLSSVGQGKLTVSRPPVSVPVLRSDGNGNVFVNPAFVDFLDTHRHHRHELATDPAGQHTPPAEGEPHEITSPDPDRAGWLPADHAVFEGRAPAGAKFGYNLSADAYLQRLWPPVPVESCHVELLRPSVYAPSPREAVPLAGSVLSDLLTIDRNGLWWMSDCYDEVPWATTLDTNASESASAEGCPRDIDVQMILWFTRVSFATDMTVVTSLRSLDSRLKVYCRDTVTAGTAGDLDLDLDLELTLGDTDHRGYLVFKELDGGTIHRGPVTEGVYATSDNVVLTSQHQTKLIIGDSSSPTVHHGLTGIGVITQPSRELPVQLVKLDGATEEYLPVLYLGLPNDFATSFIAQINLPADIPTGSQLAYRLRLLGRAAGALPQLTVVYNRVARPPDGLDTPVAVAESWTTLTIDTVATLISANTSVEALSEAIDVEPGDIVYLRVTRTPEDVGDAYAAELGIMQQVGVLTSEEA
jgi:hypothetical protein